MIKIEVLVGSVQQNRFCDKPAMYLCEELNTEENAGLKTVRGETR